MGNVVSSLLMYALQAAWFCQRLIDQDYRQNHGSRSKPIMDIDETDLDVFLSKCRSYYMSKTKAKRNNQIEYGKSSAADRGRKKWAHHRARNSIEESKSNSSLHLVHDKSGCHAQFNMCLDFDSEGFVSRMDQEMASRQADFTRLIMNGNDLGNFLSKSSEISRERGYGSERTKCDTPKTERWKRKRLYYRQRYNPRSGPDRTPEAFTSPWEATFAPKANAILTIDHEDMDLTSRDDYFNFYNEDLIFRQLENEKRVPETWRSIDENIETTSANDTVDHDLVLVIKEVDAMEKEQDQVLFGMDEKVPKILMAQDSLNGSA